MTASIIGAYDKVSVAREVIDDLIQAGCEQDDVEILSPEEEDTTGDAVIDDLVERGLSLEDAELYAEAARQGKTLVAARAPDDVAADVEAIMERHGAMSLDELEALQEDLEEDEPDEDDINDEEEEEEEDEDEDDDDDDEEEQ